MGSAGKVKRERSPEATTGNHARNDGALTSPGQSSPEAITRMKGSRCPEPSSVH